MMENSPASEFRSAMSAPMNCRLRILGATWMEPHTSPPTRTAAYIPVPPHGGAAAGSEMLAAEPKTSTRARSPLRARFSSVIAPSSPARKNVLASAGVSFRWNNVASIQRSHLARSQGTTEMAAHTHRMSAGKALRPASSGMVGTIHHAEYTATRTKYENETPLM